MIYQSSKTSVLLYEETRDPPKTVLLSVRILHRIVHYLKPKIYKKSSMYVRETFGEVSRSVTSSVTTCIRTCQTLTVVLRLSDGYPLPIWFCVSPIRGRSSFLFCNLMYVIYQVPICVRRDQLISLKNERTGERENEKVEGGVVQRRNSRGGLRLRYKKLKG